MTKSNQTIHQQVHVLRSIKEKLLKSDTDDEFKQVIAHLRMVYHAVAGAEIVYTVGHAGIYEHLPSYEDRATMFIYKAMSDIQDAIQYIISKDKQSYMNIITKLISNNLYMNDVQELLNRWKTNTRAKVEYVELVI